MNKFITAAALATSALVATVSAHATVLVPGATMQPTQPIPAGTEGTQQAIFQGPAVALTFASTFTQAVYLNSLGTLDFYYQVNRTGPGAVSDDEIRSFTVANFAGYTVDAFIRAGNFDGAGPFLAANNPTLADGTPSGSTTTFGRSPNGAVITAEFGANGLTGTENSVTYVYRTNATQFDFLGTYGIIDGSTASGLAFRPTGPVPVVPEPASWAMMIVGFGLVGGAMRRRSSTKLATA